VKAKDQEIKVQNERLDTFNEEILKMQMIFDVKLKEL